MQSSLSRRVQSLVSISRLILTELHYSYYLKRTDPTFEAYFGLRVFALRAQEVSSTDVEYSMAQFTANIGNEWIGRVKSRTLMLG